MWRCNPVPLCLCALVAMTQLRKKSQSKPICALRGAERKLIVFDLAGGVS